MFVKISAKELRGLSPEQREQRLVEGIRHTQQKPNGEVQELQQQIAEFERVHGFNTEEMRDRLTNGSLQETLPVCRWAMLANLRDELLKTA